MKLRKLLQVSAAFFVFQTFTTALPLVGVHNDGFVNVTNSGFHQETSLNKRQTANAMNAAIQAAYTYSDQFNNDPNVHRSQFTVDVVTALYKANPNYNYIICTVKHDYKFQGTWGVNVDHAYVLWGSPSISFDVVIGQAGTFTRFGDGGFGNWAYIGNVISKVDNHDSVVVTFGP